MSEDCPPGEARARRRHPSPPDLEDLPPFGDAARLLELWSGTRGHLFFEPLPLLARVLALGEATRLAACGDSPELAARAAALALRHAALPRAPWDPALFGEGWAVADRTQDSGCMILRRIRADERFGPVVAHAHHKLRARRLLESLAERCAALGPEDEWAEAIDRWLLDRFEARHMEQAVAFTAAASLLGELLGAPTDTRRLRAASSLLALTRRFAARRYQLSDGERRRCGEGAARAWDPLPEEEIAESESAPDAPPESRAPT